MACHDKITQEEYGGAGACGSHVLLLPYPSQGHVHPMLQFGKQLALHSMRPTLAVTRFILATCTPDAGAVRVAAISDGCDRGGFGECNDVTAYLNLLEFAGSETLEDLLREEARQGRPVRVLVYDAFLPWAQGVARWNGVAAAAFFTQPCAVNIVYGHVWSGRLSAPVEEGRPVGLPGLPVLEAEGLPWFLKVGAGPYPAYFEMVLSQFKGLDQADDVLVNSVYELEPEEAAYMASEWNAKTIGPTVPASYVDDSRLQSDTKYGLHLFDLTTIPCMSWLDTHPPRSVIFVSFGSLSNLDPAQMREIAAGLLDTGRPFLWVVRSSEAHKIPDGYGESCKPRGLVVSWCPQLEVLAHEAVGCFLTHCGWNSTTEALVTGMPMVAMPQWTDQPMNAEYVEAVWRVGLRVRPEDDGVVRREVVAKGVQEVMNGEKSEEYRRNATMWMKKAKDAIKEGGSSDKNITEFVAKYTAV